MINLLVNQGSTINSETVNDIARILRRRTTTQAQISDASDRLQSMHDNLWPLNGEETVGEKWSRWDSINSCDPSFKRKRMQDDDCSVTLNSTVRMDPYVTGHIGSTTTMQSSSTFSYNTSFISAAAQLQCVDEVPKTMNAKPGVLERSQPTRTSVGG